MLADYSPVIQELLAVQRWNELGPGSPNPAVRDQLAGLTVDKVFAGQTVRDEDMACCCLAGLWLHHDYLDEGHAICQDLDTPSGAYWHGIMHRREPDYANAKYWFRRVGRHDIFAPLGLAAIQLAQDHPPGREAAFLARQTSWDPFAFVDLCELVEQGQASAATLCRHLQAREWELLFDFCHRKALGP